MFAMVFEKDPLQVQDIPGGIVSWVQNAGGWAAFGVFLWLLLGYTRMRNVDRARIRPWQKTLFVAGAVVAAVGYLLAGCAAGILLLSSPTPTLESFLSICLTAGGARASSPRACPSWPASPRCASAASGR